MSFLTIRAFRSPQPLPSILARSSFRPQTAFNSSTLLFARRQPSLSLSTFGRGKRQVKTRPAYPAAQQKRFRQVFNYNRYAQSQDLYRRWKASPYFYWQVGGFLIVASTWYFTHREETPVSHRKRFRDVSYETEEALGAQQLQQIINQYGRSILSEQHPYTKMVKRVAQRLIPHSGLQDADWQVFVIASPEMNAFVIPGGKIFVFTGMFDVCKTDDSLAAVIGHEIGHNVAHHAAERASKALPMLVFAYVIWLVSGIDVAVPKILLDIIFTKTFSRTQEREADYIGLLIMAEACYDPHAAMDMWSKMEKLDGQGIPQWLSTHPSNHNRMEKIREWLPVAEEKSAESGCRGTASNAADFWSTTSKPTNSPHRSELF